MEDVDGVLAAARDAYRGHDRAGARERFAAARAVAELPAADLEALADAAWWLGDFEEASAVLEDAHRRHLEEGRPGPAAMAAIGIGVNHLLPGDGLVGSGWVSRALVKQGRMAEGMALLDEAMLAVLSGELRPEWAGNIYCHLMAAFSELADVRRAAGWTEATGRWLAGLPAAVLFTGICRIHRSQALQLKGAWAQAEREAALVCRDLAELHVAGDAIARARSGAAGLANVRFEVRDAARLEVTEPLDVVLVFDAVHDQVAPAALLGRIWGALVPGGTFVMVEPRASSNLEDNLGNPMTPMLYATSTLHCMTVSLAEGGAGLGTAWGEQRARAMLAEAGFVDVAVHEAPGDPLNAVFVASRPGPDGGAQAVRPGPPGRPSGPRVGRRPGA